MAPRPLTQEQIIEAVKLLEIYHGNISEAARSLDLHRSTFQHRLRHAAELGLIEKNPAPMPGFRIKQHSVQLDQNENVTKEWIKQVPGGEPFEVPDNHRVIGLSALTDASGNLIQTWTKTKIDGREDIRVAILEAFREYTGKGVLPETPAGSVEDLLTAYIIADHHLGLHAWAKESDEDYDLKIGEKLLMDVMGELVASTPKSDTAVILNLGDFFHSDNDSNQTRSGHHLDVDSRYAKILKVGVNLIIHCTQLALQKHRHVIVRCLAGNHDPYASIALATALSCFWDGSDRVTVDADPSYFWKMRWGNTLLTATHGDMVKPTQMPMVVASTWPEDWGQTEFRYGYLGHVHHSSSGEPGGLKWETFQTLAPKDVWHYKKGYRSGRSMVAITHSKTSGEYIRNIASVRRPA
jgi:hypothetical protein